MRFDTTTKSTDETHVLFAARLRNLLSYYYANKGMGEDFDKLCDLIIADRLKSSLPHGPLNYVLSLEGERVAYLADSFLSHRSDASSAKAGVSGSTRVAAATAADGVSGQHKGSFGQQKKGHVPASPPRRCFVCNHPGHLAKDCYSHQFGSRGNRGGTHVTLSTTREPVRTVRMQDCGVQCEEEGYCGAWSHRNFMGIWGLPIVKSVTTYSPCPQVRVFPLQYLEVSIEGNKCIALNDSGFQIPIVSNRLFGWCAEGALGRVNLHDFGQDHVVQAPLVNLTVKKCDPASESECSDVLEIPLVCAVTDLGRVDYDAILPAAVVSEFQAPVVSYVLSVGGNK